MDQQRKQLVVVEDDPAHRRLLEVVLGSEGYVVHAAFDGEAGVALVRSVLPAAIIADIMMPSVDGFEMARRLRSDPATAGIPFIFVSARSLPDDKLTGFSLGADDYITKPYLPAELLSRVQAVLRRATRAPALPAVAPATGPAPSGALLVADLFTASPGVLLAGQLSTASVIEVLQAIGWGSVSGRLTVSGAGLGVLELRSGQVVHAEVRTEHGRFAGPKAWFRIASWTRGLFELRDVSTDPLGAQLPRSIDMPLQSLLLEAAYYRDEIERLWRKIGTPDPVLVRRSVPGSDSEDRDLAVWSRIGERGLRLGVLLDEPLDTDLEVLKSVVNLRQQGALDLQSSPA